jgi:hypothetical protein
MPLPLVAGAALEGAAALASREFAKRVIQKKLAEAAASGAGAGVLATGAAGVGEALVNKPKAKREESKMGSSKNVDVGTGRGTSSVGTDSKSFSQAFREARDAGDDTFSWKGKKYTTEMADAKKPAAAPMRETMESETGTTNPSEYKRGGKVKKMATGGSVSSASKRADGCAQRGKTRGRMV